MEEGKGLGYRHGKLDLEWVLDIRHPNYGT